MYSFLHISRRREYSMTKLSDNPRDYPWFRHRMKGFESRYGVSSFLLATSRPFLPRVSAGHFRWTIFPRAQLVGLPCSACCFFFFFLFFSFSFSFVPSAFLVFRCASVRSFFYGLRFDCYMLALCPSFLFI